MSKIVQRHAITRETYRQILDAEIHHNHRIIEDEQGTLRWDEDSDTRKLVDTIGLNNVINLLYYLGYDKNSEPYRKLYRSIGYSLSGYWEIFYWEMNNNMFDEYEPITDLQLNINVESVLHMYGPEGAHKLGNNLVKTGNELLRASAKDVENATTGDGLEKRYDATVDRYITLPEYIGECYGGLPSEALLEEQWLELPFLKPEDVTNKVTVHIMEYEKGWGSSIDEIKYFDTHELAVTFCKEFNSKNTELETPDWYMIAKIV